MREGGAVLGVMMRFTCGDDWRGHACCEIWISLLLDRETHLIVHVVLMSFREPTLGKWTQTAIKAI